MTESERRELSEMTLEELWKLFPIFLVPHDVKWNKYYGEIEDSIKRLLSDYRVYRISHIGSTAIQGIWAKNIVDVLVEIPEGVDMKGIASVLAQNGFIIMTSEINRISLNMGYTKNGFADKVYHIHLRYAGDNDELYFRALQRIIMLCLVIHFFYPPFLYVILSFFVINRSIP